MSNYKGISNSIRSRSLVTQPFCYWTGVFNDRELSEIQRIMANDSLTDSMISGNVGVIDKDIRRSKVSFCTCTEQTQWIFDRLNPIIDNLNTRFFNFDINGYDTLQYSEYHASENGKYDWHVDMYVGEMPPTDIDTRKLSLVVWLNDDYEGGDFELICTSLDTPITIPKEKGKLIIFPSFLFHRVTPVTRGIRRSLVSWIYGPKFK